MRVCHCNVCLSTSLAHPPPHLAHPAAPPAQLSPLLPRTSHCSVVTAAAPSCADRHPGRHPGRQAPAPPGCCRAAPDRGQRLLTGRTPRPRQRPRRRRRRRGDRARVPAPPPTPSSSGHYAADLAPTPRQRPRPTGPSQRRRRTHPHRRRAGPSGRRQRRRRSGGCPPSQPRAPARSGAVAWPWCAVWGPAAAVRRRRWRWSGSPAAPPCSPPPALIHARMDNDAHHHRDFAHQCGSREAAMDAGLNNREVAAHVDAPVDIELGAHAERRQRQEGGAARALQPAVLRRLCGGGPLARLVREQERHLSAPPAQQAQTDRQTDRGGREERERERLMGKSEETV
jgi:hypothetical protein